MPQSAFPLEARRRRSEPIFGLITRAAAETLQGSDPAPLAAAVASARASDDEVLFACRVHGISGLVAALADERPGALAAPLHDALRADRERVRARGVRLAEDAARIAKRAREAGLPFVPLKGAVLVPRHYRDASLRPAADVDLLALPGTFDAWRALLASAGYREASATFRHVSFVNEGARAPTGFEEHPENPRPVDLHAAIREPMLGRVVDATDAYVASLAEGELHGERALLPDDDGLLLHLLLHLAPHAIGRGARLVQLVDLARLAPGPAAARVVGDALGEMGWGAAQLAARSLPGCLPPLLLEKLARWAPSDGRRRAWLARPGLQTGAEERTWLVLAELPLCAGPRDALRRLAAALPDANRLAELYGEGRGYPKALALYLRDRFGRQPASRA